MSVRARTIAAFALIVGCFAVSLSVQLWANRVRAERHAELVTAVEKELLIAEVRRRLGDAQKQIALLTSVYEQTLTSSPSLQEQRRFQQQLTEISRYLAEARRLSEGRESAEQRKFRETYDLLSRSWMLVYSALGADNAAAIAELSLTAEPLSETLFRQQLPAWEQAERANVERASSNLRATERLTSVLTATIFVLSAVVALLIAWRISKYLLSINQQLESRVVERTSALRESEERYAVAARGANDGLWDWNLREHRIYYSPRWKSMLGYLDDEIGDAPDEWFSRVHPDDRGQLDHDLRAHFEGTTAHLENEHRVLHRDGTYRWMLTRGLAMFDEGAATRIAGSQTDITARKQAEEQLVHDALHDALTGLPNRSLLLDRLSWSIARGRRLPDAAFAVLFLDIDRFKVVNDSLGHVVGDQLLVGVARRLEACVRPGDTVARFGGDEFTVLLDDVTSVPDAEQVALRIQAALASPFNIAGHDIYVTTSIGIAMRRAEHSHADELLRDADAAMYRAKSLGRARFEVFDGAMHSLALGRLQMETALRRAMERDELFLEYQPVVALADERVVGFEALVRWRRSTGEVIGPSEFIPLAEEIGVISVLGQWVLQTACRDAAGWQRAFPSSTPLTLSVNISPRQFTDRDLVQQIESAVAACALDPHTLILEITEGVLIEQPESAEALLKKVREMNVRLCLDDFGTGYSSLTTLHRYPIEMIKIDRTFISRMGLPDAGPEIAGAILTLARTLGATVTAEGVETAEQAERLRRLECGYAQGFFFAAPMEAADVARYLSKGGRREEPRTRERRLLTSAAPPAG